MTPIKADRLTDILTAACPARPNPANLRSTVVALEEFGTQTGILVPHRLAQYGAQLIHESGSFRYDGEIWGPTPAQKRYEGRRDLGNVFPGDGSRFRGRTPIQITGRRNYRDYTRWVRVLAPGCPDFEANPELVNTDPYEGLGPLWYWRTRSLNTHADRGDIKRITRIINGGYNGFDDRLKNYDRMALVTLGYRPTEIREFQEDRKITADGISGPITRGQMHSALVEFGR